MHIHYIPEERHAYKLGFNAYDIGMAARLVIWRKTLP